MSGNLENPSFIDDEGKSPYSFAPAQKSPNEHDHDKNTLYNTIDLKDLKKSEKAGEYDPYKDRDVQHPTTNAETFLHLMKGSIGTGILSMPLAFRHSGYLVGTIATVIIGAICTNGIHLLISASHELCKRRKIPSLTYPGTAETAFYEGPYYFKKLAPFAITIINFFLVVYQLGVCCVYTVFIGENLKDVADQYMEALDVKIWMLIVLLPLIIINYIRNLKFLAPFSTFANFVTIGSFGIILYYLVMENMTFENRNPVGEIQNFPLYFGTVLFALEAIGVIMPLENEMKTPKSFTTPFGILNVAMVIIISLYTGMGLLGYLSYGPHVEDTITLNIGKTEVLAQTAKVLLAVAIFITHPLQLYVAIDILWNQYLSPRMQTNKFLTFWEYVIRTSLVLVTFALAVAVPRLDLFISLFGAFSLSALGLIFPALISMSTFWYTLIGVRGCLIIVKNLIIIAFGIVGLIVGTWISLKNIIESFE